MKTAFRLLLLMIVAALCLSLCACESAAPEISDEKSEPAEEKLVLIQGDFKPVEGLVITYDEAFALYGDRFYASLAASSSRESCSRPAPHGDVEQIRVSMPERNLFLEETFTAPNIQDAKTYEVYYGYYSQGKWQDFPAGNYPLKALPPATVDGYSAATYHHVVKIGPYILIAFADGWSMGTSAKDTLGSTALDICEGDLSPKNSYAIVEYALAPTNEEYKYLLGPHSGWCYVALEYDKIPKDYSITFTTVGPGESITFTYEDIMTALNRE